MRPLHKLGPIKSIALHKAVRSSAGITLLLGGACIPVPAEVLPEEKRVIGRSVTAERSEFLQPGVAKATVLQRLGPPNVVWREKNVLAYDWQKVEAIVVFAFALPALVGAGTFPMGGHHFLLIRFDARDRVCHYARSVRAAGQSYGEFLTAFSSQSPPDARC